MTPPTSLPQLRSPCWPATAYERAGLPERVLQFGTGGLLRALCAATFDAANRARTFNGRIVAIQSTPNGRADALNAQDGQFTLVERGIDNEQVVDRTTLIGSISRALVANTEWPAVRELAARPELSFIVSNVTEAGFRLGAGDAAHGRLPDLQGGELAPESFPAKIADLLYTRFRHAAGAPPLTIIPTELVDENGPRLSAMVGELAGRFDGGPEFSAWIAGSVRFCLSLVGRITTGTPAAEERAALEERLGYRDHLLTLTEPYSLWAIESGERGDIADVSGAVTPAVVVAPDISWYRDRKLRLLNGAHTAMAPLALLAGVSTVREATEHPRLGPYLRRALLDEIVPSVELPAEEVTGFARVVLERFASPGLAHAWSVIATNQTAKLRIRVMPSITGYIARHADPPRALTLALAAYVRFTRCMSWDGGDHGTGWWRGTTYHIADVDLPAVAAHWRAVEGAPAEGPVADETLALMARRVLGDERLWGADLSRLPGLVTRTAYWLARLERDGVATAVDEVLDTANTSVARAAR